MRKILSSILVLVFVTEASAQVSDTSAYLRNTIQANKAYYIGKPLSTLLNDLQIGVKSYSEVLPLPNLPDPIPFERTSLYFQTNAKVTSKFLQHVKVPSIEIKFASAIAIPKAYLKKGGLLDNYTDWTTAKANFFGQYIVSSLEVRGVQ